MINEHNAKLFCYQDIRKIENYEQANADNIQTWHLHHRKETDECKTKSQLIEEGLYFNRPANELIFLTHSDHIRLHMSGKHFSAETREKISKAKREAMTVEVREKISKATREAMTAETREKMRKAKLGRQWWNNGQRNKFAKECPGAEWQKGLLYRH